MDVGIYEGLDNSLYQNDAGISRSSIVCFKYSPFKFYSHYLKPREKKEPTSAMIFGSAFHTFMLEHKSFNDLYAVQPKRVYKKDDEQGYKDYLFKLELLEQSQLTIITQEEYDTLVAMRQALFENNRAWDLLEGAAYEQSYFWDDAHSGLRVKCRPDVVHSQMVIDLKTVSDASEKAITRAIFDYGYDIQMAMIQDGIFALTENKIESFILVCIEKHFPYAIGIYILGKDVIERGKSIYKNALLELRDCFLKDEWPDYPETTIFLPNYLK